MEPAVCAVRRVVDLNADLGEGFGVWAMGDDTGLLGEVTSANVACGFHAGDPSTMRRVCEAAVERGVRVGAHVGYRDLAGFGRRDLTMASSDLRDETTYQLAALDGIARASGDRVRYVKPHGALYNRAFYDADQAQAVIDGVRAYDDTMPVLGMPNSMLLRLASHAGLPSVTEGFPDRAYTPEGRLCSRSEPGSVLHDADQISRRAVQMATHHQVESSGGSLIPVPVRSLCVHGDTPGALTFARSVRAALVEAGVDLVAFT